jgi:DNA-directed RNA polymerase specialized sigma24 family protein
MSATDRRSVVVTLGRIATRPRLRSVDEPRDTRRAAQDQMPLRSPMQRCHEHIDALYLLAYLYTFQHDTAEDVVVDVLASSATHRAIMVAGPPWVWHILAEQIHGRSGQRLAGIAASDEPALALARAGLSSPQREAIALVGTGRKASEAAALLGVTTTQVHLDLRAGLQGLAGALSDCRGTTCGERSASPDG